MAWARATIQIKPASTGTGIKASLKKRQGGVASLSISMTGAAFVELGWSNGDKIVVEIGTHEHHGLIRLQKNNSTGQAEYLVKDAVRGGKYGVLPLGHQSAFVDRGETARWCQWEKVEGGWIEIVLPKWADETAPNRKPASAAVMPPSGGSSQRRGASVTSTLMGDPPPGRREMLEKIGKLDSA